MAKDNVEINVGDVNSNVQKKVCIKCGELKALSEFYTHSAMLDGHLGDCKVCRRAYERNRRSVDPVLAEKVRARARERYHFGGTAVKDRIVQATTKRRQELQSDSRFRLERLLGSKRSSCKERNIACDLSLDYLVALYSAQKGVCPLTNFKMTLGIAENNMADRNAMSIDRIDQTKGYVIGNVRLTTSQANIARHRFSDGDLLDFCYAIISNFEKIPDDWGVVPNLTEIDPETVNNGRIIAAQQDRRRSERENRAPILSERLEFTRTITQIVDSTELL